MNPTLRNILAVIAGWIIGSILNGTLVMVGHKVFPIEGIDSNNIEELSASMSELDFNYFIFPFLAHALGTLVGASLAAIIAVNHKMKMALAVGVIFLIGGIIACFMITAPAWFIAVDLIFAYIPMAWLGGKIGMKISKKKI